MELNKTVFLWLTCLNILDLSSIFQKHILQHILWMSTVTKTIVKFKFQFPHCKVKKGTYSKPCSSRLAIRKMDALLARYQCEFNRWLIYCMCYGQFFLSCQVRTESSFKFGIVLKSETKLRSHLSLIKSKLHLLNQSEVDFDFSW